MSRCVDGPQPDAPIKTAYVFHDPVTERDDPDGPEGYKIIEWSPEFVAEIAAGVTAERRPPTVRKIFDGEGKQQRWNLAGRFAAEHGITAASLAPHVRRLDTDDLEALFDADKADWRAHGLSEHEWGRVAAGFSAFLDRHVSVEEIAPLDLADYPAGRRDGPDPLDPIRTSPPAPIPGPSMGGADHRRRRGAETVCELNRLSDMLGRLDRALRR